MKTLNIGSNCRLNKRESTNIWMSKRRSTQRLNMKLAIFMYDVEKRLMTPVKKLCRKILVNLIKH